MGAYVFEAEPPFAITLFPTEPLIGNRFYNETFGWAFRAQDFIVFPLGCVVSGDTLFVSMGWQDQYAWLMELNIPALIKSLTPVKSRTLNDRFDQHIRDIDYRKIDDILT
jgi:predicted GH43/DUF377 family glycosyl hydrolase